MPILGLGLHIIVAVFFAIHAMRTGRNMTWLFVLFAFPLLGSIVYFFAEYMGDMRNNPAARKAYRAMEKALDPERELRDATREYEISPSVQNRMRLAAAELNKGNAAAARDHYRASLNGPMADDPEVLRGLARAEIETGDGESALHTLAALAKARPDFHPDDVALLEARACALSRAQPETLAAFEAAAQLASGLEAKARFIAWLVSVGQLDAARRIQADIDQSTKHWPAHARDLNAPWFTLAQQALAQGEAAR
ncbi:MAG TPA: tetratricopeptide repeat protein [Burkholderiaceae bacterium]|nr:tetratricopeptide repeat protein [Burkholderiaceae bacterium]